MRAEIISFSDGHIYGKLFSRYLEQPYEFYSFVRLIEKMEEIFDVKGFPEKFLQARSFGNTNNKTMRKAERNGAMNESVNPTKQDEAAGSKCTFEITVRFRQNATWQGQILWAEKDLRQNFRSVLEMLKLMDEALVDGQDKTATVEWGEKKDQ